MTPPPLWPRLVAVAAGLALLLLVGTVARALLAPPEPAHVTQAREQDALRRFAARVPGYRVEPNVLPPQVTVPEWDRLGETQRRLLLEDLAREWVDSRHAAGLRGTQVRRGLGVRDGAGREVGGWSVWWGVREKGVKPHP